MCLRVRLTDRVLVSVNIQLLLLMEPPDGHVTGVAGDQALQDPLLSLQQRLVVGRHDEAGRI